MATLLHLLTDSDDPLACKIIALQKEEPGQEVVVVDLARVEPDYPALLRKIFQADSVTVW
jgi:hypothetical protein